MRYKLHTKTPDREAEGSILFRSVGVREILYQTFKDFGSLAAQSIMVFPRSGISSENPADDAKLVNILPKWLSWATKLEIRQATLEKPCAIYHGFTKVRDCEQESSGSNQFLQIPFIACRGTLCNLNFVNRLVTLCAIYIIETKRLETFYNQI